MNCKGCLCYKSMRDQWIIEFYHWLNDKLPYLLNSYEWIQCRRRWCIEPDAIFQQMMFNIVYRRFQHSVKDKVSIDFAFFTLCFNIKIICLKMAKCYKWCKTPNFCILPHLCRILTPKNRIIWNSTKVYHLFFLFSHKYTNKGWAIKRNYETVSLFNR